MFRYLMAGPLLVAGCGGPLLCVGEGDGYDRKTGSSGPCCGDLTAANTTEAPDTDGVCTVVDLNPAKVCIACGDGECGEAENMCNCPEDCG